MSPTPEPSRKPPLARKHAWQTSLSSEARIAHVRHPFDAGTLETLTRRLAEGRDSYGAQALSASEPPMIVTAAPPIRSGRRRRGGAGGAGAVPRLHAGASQRARHDRRREEGGAARLAEGIQQEGVAAGRQHDRTQVGGHRQETILKFAGPQV